MKHFTWVAVLVGTLALSGCMATISPDGTVSASYILPEVNAVVVGPSPRPVQVAHRPTPRPHSWPSIYGPHGRQRPR